MNLYFHIFISLCCIAIVYIFSAYNYLWKINTSDPLVLVTGIISARENFKLREAARSTWLKHYSSNKNQTIKAWFIIGKDECNIPPEYRLSKYGCTKWNITTPVNLVDHFYTSEEIHSNACNFKKAFNQGFSFKVNHPITVKRLGILIHLLVPNIATNVAILDIQSKEIVVQASITKNSSYLENGYLYEDVEPVLLPKHYEGMVLVEGYLQKEGCVKVLWNDGGGVITFNRIYLTPSHLDSIEFRNDVYSAASIQFLVHDLNGLKDLISEEDRITSEWLSHLKNVNKKILLESEEKQDILFVDVMDTYRNLPVKLLHFYKWVDQNYKFSFLMKIDDDTMVDIAYLVDYMKNHSSFKQNKPWIWSRFRKDWPVNYIGKWADYEYRSSIYPAFPCGATYIMSHKTVQWLSLNANFLFPYQGEDVSMGIWLSAIKPDFIDDEHFECNSMCNKRSYNRAQLIADQIYEIWSKYETCQNLCC